MAIDLKLPSCPYTALGVPKDASISQIKTAYRKLALKCHPDKVKDQSQVAAKQAEFQSIQSAYELLSDEEKKTEYLQKLELHKMQEQLRARMASMASENNRPGPERRSTEPFPFPRANSTPNPSARPSPYAPPFTESPHHGRANREETSKPDPWADIFQDPYKNTRSQNANAERFRSPNNSDTSEDYLRARREAFANAEEIFPKGYDPGRDQAKYENKSRASPGMHRNFEMPRASTMPHFTRDPDSFEEYEAMQAQRMARDREEKKEEKRQKKKEQERERILKELNRKKQKELDEFLERERELEKEKEKKLERERGKGRERGRANQREKQREKDQSRERYRYESESRERDRSFEDIRRGSRRESRRESVNDTPKKTRRRIYAFSREESSKQRGKERRKGTSEKFSSKHAHYDSESDSDSYSVKEVDEDFLRFGGRERWKDKHDYAKQYIKSQQGRPKPPSRTQSFSSGPSLRSHIPSVRIQPSPRPSYTIPSTYLGQSDYSPPRPPSYSRPSPLHNINTRDIPVYVPQKYRTQSDDTVPRCGPEAPAQQPGLRRFPVKNRLFV